MQVSELLDSLGFRPYVEVVIAALPEPRLISTDAEVTRNVLLEHLNRDRQLSALLFTHEEMNVFGHDYVSGDEHAVPAANIFQRPFEHSSGQGRAKQRLTTITAEGDEMKIRGSVVTLESRSHETNLACSRDPVSFTSVLF